MMLSPTGSMEPKHQVNLAVVFNPFFHHVQKLRVGCGFSAPINRSHRMPHFVQKLRSACTRPRRHRRGILAVPLPHPKRRVTPHLPENVLAVQTLLVKHPLQPSQRVAIFVAAFPFGAEQVRAEQWAETSKMSLRRARVCRLVADNVISRNTRARNTRTPNALP